MVRDETAATPDAHPKPKHRMTTMKAQFMGAFLWVAAVLVAPALAHHSFAMFDTTKVITIAGTVKEFQWTNPHVYVQLLVPNSAGQVEEWSIEGASPNMLYRAGWNKESLKTGDRVTMVVNPLRSGEIGGAFVSCTLPDGRVIYGIVPKVPTVKPPT